MEAVIRSLNLAAISITHVVDALPAGNPYRAKLESALQRIYDAAWAIPLPTYGVSEAKPARDLEAINAELRSL